MLAVVFDIRKFIDRIAAPYREEVDFLRGYVKEKDTRIHELEVMLFKRAGFIAQDQVASDVGEVIPARVVRSWREQKKVLENKFRPPELAEREARWKDVAQKMQEEVEEDAS